MAVEATIDNLYKVNNFILKGLKVLGCDDDGENQILLSCEEIFSNICNYSYENKFGFVLISFKIIFDERMIIITFWDNGIPYNPLEQEDPDVNADAERKSIGGLGIFIVKNMMDRVYYIFKNGKNIFTMEKKI